MTADRMDGYDRHILAVLSANGRITWSDLADEIGLSLTPTVRRVRMLEEAGYIRGYGARLDEARLAGTMVVFITVTLERQVRVALEDFEGEVAKLPEIMSGYLMSGSADYLLRAVVRGLDHYRDLLEALTRLPNVAHIQSSFALKSFVSRHSPIVD